MELTLSVFAPIEELSLEHGTIRPLLSAETILVVRIEFSDVPASVCVHVDALSTGLAVAPDALIAVTVGVDKPSRPTCLPFFPETFVTRAIWPELNAAAHSNNRLFASSDLNPLTLVKDAVFDLNWFSLAQRRSQVLTAGESDLSKR